MKLHLYYLANEEILYIYYTYYRALVEMNNLLFIHFFSIFSGTMLMLVIIALHSTAQITKKSFLDSSEVSVTTNLVLVIMITLISKPWRSRLKKKTALLFSSNWSFEAECAIKIHAVMLIQNEIPNKNGRENKDMKIRIIH